MNNLQIGDNDLVGNKFNGHNLHFYLKEKGINSSHLVWNKVSNDKNTFVIKNNDLSRNEKRNIIIDLQNEYNLNGINNFLFYDILYNKSFLESDIVHFHLIHNWLIDVNLLPIISKIKPTIWSLHDPWILSGHCVHHYNCNKWKIHCNDCPHLSSHFPLLKDNSALNFAIKKRSIQDSNITFIVASKWMYKKVCQSPIFKNKNVYLVPFGIDNNIFKIKDKNFIRNKFNIPADAFVILFRCDYSEFKGNDYINYVLSNLNTNKKVFILTVADKLKEKIKFKTIEFGWVKDDKILSEIYNASDVFLAPSKAETFGMMAVEAMSCGCVPIVLDGTALKETVNSPNYGISVNKNKKEYLRVLEFFIKDKESLKKRSEKCAEFAAKKYNKEQYISSIIKIYKEKLSEFNIDNEGKLILHQLKKHMSVINTPNNKRVLNNKQISKVEDLKNPLLKLSIINFYKLDKLFPKYFRLFIKNKIKNIVQNVR